MTLDKEEHRNLLLELIAKAAFPGAAVDVVLELRNAVRDAYVHVGPVDAPLDE